MEGEFKKTSNLSLSDAANWPVTEMKSLHRMNARDCPTQVEVMIILSLDSIEALHQRE